MTNLPGVFFSFLNFILHNQPKDQTNLDLGPARNIIFNVMSLHLFFYVRKARRVEKGYINI